MEASAGDPKMERSEKIRGLVFAAIDQLNDTLPPDRHLAKEGTTPLRDSGGAIDSLGLALFIVDLERRLEDELGVSVGLVGGSTMSEENSPFRSVDHLVAYIEQEAGGSGS
jgi:hypothetical protein